MVRGVVGQDVRIEATPTNDNRSYHIMTDDRYYNIKMMQKVKLH